ncbi:MAG: dual specificity protein phosphatase family protein [Emcibacter sp.]|nr:dual specificity protein phosphatase family protein [Emcibacter sp.]
MIKKILLSLSLISGMILSASAYENTFDLKKEPVIGTLAGVTSLNNWLYMAGQPDQATIKELKSKGFDVVINIRGPHEMNFDEKSLVEANDMAYFNVPLLKDGEMQEQAVVDILAAVMANRNKKILFHCSSGNRIAAWFAAHMIRDHGYETEAAITLAKQAGMTKAGTERMLRNYLAKIAR